MSLFSAFSRKAKEQRERNQFTKECNPNDLMMFSHYPTKPLGGADGGVIVTDDYKKYAIKYNSIGERSNNKTITTSLCIDHGIIVCAYLTHSSSSKLYPSI